MKTQKSNDGLPSIDIRYMKSSDIPQIINLIQAFEYPFGEEHYRWKYFQSPWNNITLVAEVNDEIIGHHGTILRPFWVQNQHLLIGLKADLIIRPEYRGRGLFSKMINITKQEMLSKGLDYTYAFPNVMSFPRSQTLQMGSLGYQPLYIKILQIKAVLRKLGKFRFLTPFSRGFSFFFRSRAKNKYESIEVKEVLNYPDSINHLWNEVIADPQRSYQIIGLRTKEFLEWRFKKCPDRDYKLILATDQQGKLRGYLILRITEVLGLKEGAIMDIFHSPFDQGASTSLLSYVINYCIDNSVDLIACLLTDSSNCLHQILPNHGFRRFTKRFNPVPCIVVIQHTSSKNVDPWMLKSNQWFLTFADDDVL
ncbi:MAG: GNAT family N-acetyltransferase [Candidatus Heimdallarchaeota archaeon]|nr:MAG: GNAT family N-acetyltransferase [Candidatus Heimdallarchaeota archaeon]